MTTVEVNQSSPDPPPTAPSSTRSTQAMVNLSFPLMGWTALPVTKMARVPSNASSACPFIVVAATVGDEKFLPLNESMFPALLNAHGPRPARFVQSPTCVPAPRSEKSSACQMASTVNAQSAPV